MTFQDHSRNHTALFMPPITHTGLYRYRYILTLLRLESRITCYEQKCLKVTKMTHNKSSGTDTDTYTDIY